METISKLNTFINQKASFVQSNSLSPSYAIQVFFIFTHSLNINKRNLGNLDSADFICILKIYINL